MLDRDETAALVQQDIAMLRRAIKDARDSDERTVLRAQLRNLNVILRALRDPNSGFTVERSD